MYGEYDKAFGGSVCLTAAKRLFDGIILSSPTLDVKGTLHSYFNFKNVKELEKKCILYFWEPIGFPIKFIRLKVYASVIEDAIKSFHYRKAAQSLRCPVLLFYGSHDHRTLKSVRQDFFKMIRSKRKKLVMIKHGSHNALSFWFATDVADKVNSFLREEEKQY